MYSYLNNKFNNSEKKVKIEIYLLTFIICFSFILFIKDYTPSKNFIKTSILPIEKKTFNQSFFDLIKDIELYTKKENIQIIKIESSQKTLKITGNTSLYKLKKLVKKIEGLNEFSNIIIFYFYKSEKLKKYSFQFDISFDKFYIKQKSLEAVIKKKVKTQIIRFKLKAIISKNVLINNTWMKKNDFIKGYKLINIRKNSVLLENKSEDKKIILKVFKNDKYAKLSN